MRDPIKPGWYVVATLTVATLAAVTIAAFRPPAEARFAAANRSALDTMTGHMQTGHSGNVDRDFATMMIPHHQGAIDMALAELRHGSDVRLRRLAQGIVVEQRQEIEAMQALLDAELAGSDATIVAAQRSAARARPACVLSP